MSIVATIVRNGIAPAWARWERSAYLRHYKDLLRTQFEALGRIQRRQNERVQCIVEHAYRSVTFWRKRMDEISIRPEMIASTRDLSQLPLLTKGDVRAFGEQLRSTEHLCGSSLHIRSTSGSTGTSVKVYVDDDAQQFQWACTLRSDSWTGWRLGELSAKVWGNPEYLSRGWRGWLRNVLLERAFYLDTLKMDKDAIARFTYQLRRRKPTLIFGHAHSLYLLAMFVEAEGGIGYRPRGVLSSAMVLHDHERSKIEQVFGCKVTNRYGCEEVGLIACECEQHRGLHINSDNVYVEIIRPDGTPCDPGEAGSVVVTDLHNRAMPIIRYKIGDTAVASDRLCPCGRGLPLIESLAGREADYVYTASGEFVSGISLTENFAVLVPGIRQLQIIQERIDYLRLRIARTPDFGPRDDQQIAQLIHDRFGDSMSYALEFVDAIQPEPSGKYRFCISKVSNPYTSGTSVEAGAVLT